MDKQADRFLVKTVGRIADLVGQDYKSGGNTHTEVMTQANILIPAPVRPTYAIVLGYDGATVSTTPPHALLISVTTSQQSKTKLHMITRFSTRMRAETRYILSCGSKAPNQCMPRLSPMVSILPLKFH